MSSLTLAQLQRLRSTDAPAWGPPERGGATGASGFGETLSEAIDAVDASQKEADGQIEAFVAGEQEDLHEVMISMNEARLHFQLMVEVRNKTLETYQELMRMQV